MLNRSSLTIARNLVVPLVLSCLWALPATGQQAVGPGMLGGTPPCIAGTNPALFDHSFDGPTPDDLPAYFEPGGDYSFVARYPTEVCNSPDSNRFFMYEATSGNPWPGALNTATGLFGGGWFEADVEDDNGDFIGGTYYYFSSSGGDLVAHPLLLLESPTTAGAYDRVQATGGSLDLVGGIQGWDLEPQDGVADYIGLSWENLVLFGSCPDAPPLDQTMMLWVPVVPVVGGPAGAVAIQFDLDCDGVADSGFPPSPRIVPETTVPVGLQSFSITAVLPSSPGGVVLAVLFCVLPIGALRLARRWLTGARD